MNKEDLILKLIGMLCSGDDRSPVASDSSVLGSSVVGNFVVCRSRNEGINAGIVVELDDTGVILKDVRRIWYHKPKDVNTSWYEGVAVSGISDDSKVSCTVECKVIVEDYSLVLCSDEAKQSIMGKTPNAQN